MDIEATYKAIHGLSKTISGGKADDVMLVYKGKDYGVTKPWVARIDSYEFTDETHDGALLGLMLILKQKLRDKIKSAESEAQRLQQVYNQLGN